MLRCFYFDSWFDFRVHLASKAFDWGRSASIVCFCVPVLHLVPPQSCAVKAFHCVTLKVVHFATQKKRGVPGAERLLCPQKDGPAASHRCGTGWTCPLEFGNVPLRKPDAPVSISLQYREKAENRIKRTLGKIIRKNTRKQLSSTWKYVSTNCLIIIKDECDRKHYMGLTSGRTHIIGLMRFKGSFDQKHLP